MRCGQIFCEACTHGTLPWMGEHQRRAVLYKYNAGHMSWGGGGLPLHGEHIVLHMHTTDWKRRSSLGCVAQSTTAC
eukprot:COSAG04_NODE_19_length_39217_cov_21.535968_18_plen_76_part_00